jgi:hypothetical protein
MKKIMILISLMISVVANANSAADTLSLPSEVKSVEVGFSINEIGDDFVYTLMCRLEGGGAAPVIVRRDGQVEVAVNSFTAKSNPSYNGYWFMNGLWNPVSLSFTLEGYEWVNTDMNLHEVATPNKLMVGFNYPKNPLNDISIEKSNGNYLVYLQDNLIAILR